MGDDKLFIWLSDRRIVNILCGNPIWDAEDSKNMIRYRIGDRDRAVSMPELGSDEAICLAKKFGYENIACEKRINEHDELYVYPVGSLKRMIKLSAFDSNAPELIRMLFGSDRFYGFRSGEKRIIRNDLKTAFYQAMVTIIVDAVNKYLFPKRVRLIVRFSGLNAEFSMRRLCISDYISDEPEPIFAELNDCGTACEDMIYVSDGFKRRSASSFKDTCGFFSIKPEEIAAALSIDKKDLGRAKFFRIEDNVFRLHKYLNSRCYKDGYFLMNRYEFAALLNSACITLTTNASRCYRMDSIARMLDMDLSTLDKLSNASLKNRSDSLDIDGQYNVIQVIRRMCRDHIGYAYDGLERLDRQLEDLIYPQRYSRWRHELFDNFISSATYLSELAGIDNEDVNAVLPQKLAPYELRFLFDDSNYITDYEERIAIICSLIFDSGLLDLLRQQEEPTYSCRLKGIEAYDAFCRLNDFINAPFNYPFSLFEVRDADINLEQLWYYDDREYERIAEELYTYYDIEEESEPTIDKMLEQFPIEVRRLVMTFVYAFCNDVSKSCFDRFKEENPRLCDLLNADDPETFIWGFKEKIYDGSSNKNNILQAVKSDFAAMNVSGGRTESDILSIVNRLAVNKKTIKEITEMNRCSNSRIKYDESAEGMFRFCMLYSDVTKLKCCDPDSIGKKLRFTKDEWLLWMNLMCCIKNRIAMINTDRCIFDRQIKDRYR